MTNIGPTITHEKFIDNMKLVKESIEDVFKPKSKEEINTDIESLLGPYKDFIKKSGLKKEDKIKPEDILFSGGSSNDSGYGAGSGNPKLSYQIAGLQPRWKALYRGDDDMGHLLMGLVEEFLNDNKTKQKIAKMINDKEDLSLKIHELKTKLHDDGVYNSWGECHNKAVELVNLSLRYIK